MTIITSRLIGGFIWLPRPFTPVWKIYITRTNGTVDDVTNDRRYLEFNRPTAYNGVGTFKLILDNSNGFYTNLYSGGETVKFYIDWTNGTTLMFTGVMEKQEKSFKGEGARITLYGTSKQGKGLDLTVTESYTNVDGAIILKNLITTYLTGFTSNNVPASIGTNVTVNWSNKVFWDCLTDLCKACTADIYVDSNSDFHMFAENSVATTLDACVFDDNIQETDGLYTDQGGVKNKVIVYGKDKDGNTITYTSQDTSQSIVREVIINDENIKTSAQAKTRADAELAYQKAAPVMGKVTTLGMTYANPGELIWITIPPHQIHSQYKIYNILYIIDENGLFKCTLDVAKPTKGSAIFFKQQFVQNLASTIINNPNKMSKSLSLNFSDMTDISSLSGLSLSNGRLVLSAGSSNGYMLVSPINAAITAFELRSLDNDTGASLYQYSTDNSTWITVNKNTSTAVSTSTLYIKITLISNSTYLNPYLSSLVILYL